MSPEVAYFGVVVGGLGVLTFASSPSSELQEPTDLDDDGRACTELGGELVPADPAALAKGMGVEPAVLALARVIESEAGGLPWIAQIGVAWTVVNHARAVGRSVLAVIVRSRLGKADGTGDGFFGRQGNARGGYRYVASSKNSTADSRATAEAVIGGDIDDPTGGAVNFDSPQSYGVQEGTEASGADEFADNRASEGKRKLVLPGTNENRIRFWVPA
jgi:hypothetical protein